ncbi:hypothetical protein [uncultured Bacteroides sp.]|uniref:DUF5003 domain-containing protein n=1 Tax=uncultured Bacteroides sp. TaxID=162156 RepID=UPI0025D41F12|nr:hypothetical protein [uncultured Bacteroides sp.]
MKALNLKNVSWSLIVSAMMCMVAFAGCSDDEKEGGATGGENKIPELIEETHEVGDEITLSFTANADWILSSNASWCKFVDGDFAETTKKGKAGEQTVKMKIFDEGQDYLNDNTAVIKLKIGNEEKEIYKAIRPKKIFTGLVIKSVPAEGEKEVVYDTENPIVIKGCDVDGKGEDLLIQTSVTEAGLEVGIAEGDNPDWITIGRKDENFNLTFNKDNKEKLDPKYSFGTDKGYTIKFAVQKGGVLFATAEIPVVYEGMKADELGVAPKYPGVRISENGKKIRSTDSNNNSTVYQDKIEAEITARNDEFEIIAFEQQGEFVAYPGVDPYYEATGFVFGEQANIDWVHVAKEGTKCTLTFDQYVVSEEYDNRGVVVMALPKAVYEGIKDKLETEIITEGYISSKYASYIIAAPVQTADAIISFTAPYVLMDMGMGSELFSVLDMGIVFDYMVKYDAEKHNDIVIENPGTENVYVAQIIPELFYMSEDQKLYYEIKDGVNNMTLEGELEELSAKLMSQEGKNYMVVSAKDIENVSIKNQGNIIVKDAEGEILALIVVKTSKSPM